MNVTRCFKQSAALLLSLVLLTTLLVSGSMPAAAAVTAVCTPASITAGSATSVSVAVSGLSANTWYRVRIYSTYPDGGTNYSGSYVEVSGGVTTDTAGAATKVIPGTDTASLAAGNYAVCFLDNAWDTQAKATLVVVAAGGTTTTTAVSGTPSLTANKTTLSAGETVSFTLQNAPAGAEFGVLSDNGSGQPVNNTLVANSYRSLAAGGNSSQTVTIPAAGSYVAAIWTTGWSYVATLPLTVEATTATSSASGAQPRLTVNKTTIEPGYTFAVTLENIPAGAEFGLLQDDGNGNPVKGTVIGYAQINEGSCTKYVTMNTAGKYVAAVWTSGWNFLQTQPVTVAVAIPAKPAAPAAPIPTIRLATSLKVLTVAGYEYKLNDGEWQSGPTFTGLIPGTTYRVYQRVAATGTEAASDSSPAIEMTTRLRGPAAPEAPIATIRMATSLKVLTVPGYQYRIEGGEWQNSAKFTNLKPGTTYRVYQRVAMTDTLNPSDASPALVITTRQRGPAAPAAPVATIRLATSIKVATVAGYQYKLDDGEWQNSPTFKGLRSNTTYRIYQRIAQTDTHNPSDAGEPIVLTTRLPGPAAPAKPVATIRTAYSIKVETKAGYQYRIEGGEWQNNPRFNNLQPNTTYKVYQRIAATDTHNPSDSSPAVWITTLDGPVITPPTTTTTTKPTTTTTVRPTTTTTTAKPTTTTTVRPTTTTVTTTTTTISPTTPGGYPTDRKLVVACIGDSITEMEYFKDNFFGMLPADAYEVKGFGLSGATALNGTDKPYAASTNFAESKACNPDIVIIMLGTNDSRASKWDIPANQNGEKFIQDYLSLIEAYRSLPSHPTVLIATPPTVHKEYAGITEEYVKNKVIPAVYEVARQAGTPLIDVHTATADQGAEFWYDGVHPSSEGGKKEIAKPIAAAILKEVAGEL